MLLLILGLVLLLGAHTFTTLREPRAAFVGRIGEGPYKGLYSLVSLAGLLLIIYGYGQYRLDRTDVATPLGLRHLTVTLMWFAFVALAAAYSPNGWIRSRLKHPMLVAVKIWAFAHLLVNWDIGSLVLFGSVLAWAVYDRIAVKRRPDAVVPPRAPFGRGDVVALVVGTILYVAMIKLHPVLIGVPVMG